MMATTDKILSDQQIRQAQTVIRKCLRARGVAASELDDLVQEALIETLRFDKTKTVTLKTWASRCADNAAKRAGAANKREQDKLDALEAEGPPATRSRQRSTGETMPDGRRLRGAVREVALGEFRKRWGIEWNDHLERQARPPAAVLKREKQARAALTELARVVRSIRAIAALPDLRMEGNVVALTRWCAEQQLREALTEAPDWKDWPPADASRRWIAYEWARRPPMIPSVSSVSVGVRAGRAERDELATVQMTPRELAIVSLLAGNWPNLKRGQRYTVKGVIEQERSALTTEAKRAAALSKDRSQKKRPKV